MSIIQEALRKAQGQIKKAAETHAADPKKEEPKKAPPPEASDGRAFQRNAQAKPAAKAGHDPKAVAILLVVLVVTAVLAASQLFPMKNVSSRPAAQQGSVQSERVLPASRDASSAPAKVREFPSLQSIVFQKPEEKKPDSPEFVLNGIMYLDGGPRAIINDTMVEVGDTVNGAKVIKIDKRNVILQYNDAEVTLDLK